ncbi:MAG: inorganic phosphate transporter [Paludibacter sp.]|jgi:phosphate/sulfate permease|nr:inorganic phosphate transporter [Paludibacter sp.]
MDPIYIVIVLVLLALASLDLVVGVANDAVNFLNSGIGSRVAPRWVILTVASIGIIVGSLFSSGMMEIARSGVFHPGMFTFPQIMMLFLAVMVTDVILLDVFNTFGLPTSTTVSLIFELLGAAVAVALFNIWQTDAGVLIDYINAGKTMGIISGILVSVVIAFTVGTLVMWLSRLLFSFRYQKTFLYFGGIWTGLALTAISYFAVFKGLKGTTLISKENMLLMQENIGMMLLFTFIGWSVVMSILQHVFKVNILKIIILLGTASLALAFAGNDLVNFIGVFMAGLSSYEIASGIAASGGNVETLMMQGLSDPVNVDWRYLFGAGIIMVLALWFSKKARTVTKTEVNLSRQGDGMERFNSTVASRTIVRRAIQFNKKIEKLLPQSINNFIDRRFSPLNGGEKGEESFDLIRASVNLTVSALLISLGTSLKLPLSTTYVTFMVAMGSSLADRAWGRESAVYRITGVLTVISGWFLTAFVAFTIAALVAFALMYGGLYAVAGSIALVVVLFLQFTRIHKKREAKEVQEDAKLMDSGSDIIENCTREFRDSVQTTIQIYKGLLDGLFTEDRKGLMKLYKVADEFHGRSKRRRSYEVLPTLQKLEHDALETGQFYVQLVDYFYEISIALRYMTESAYRFIDNNHEGFTKEQIEDMRLLGDELIDLFNDFNTMIETSDYSGLKEIKERRASILDLYANLVKRQISRTKEKESGTRNSILYLNLLNETKSIVLKSANLMRAQMGLFNSAEQYQKQ